MRPKDTGISMDLETFEQILELDEGDENREFSKSVVFGWLDQATECFSNMDTALQVG